MKLLLSLSLLLGLTAHADFYSPFFCGEGYRWDSYGHGLEAGYRGVEVQVRMIDGGCYSLGKQKGIELAEGKGTVGAENADREFESGRTNGFNVSRESAGSEYFNAGYSAGMAALHSDSREGKGTVGVICLAEYQRGLGDGSSHMAASPSSNAREMECYMTGHWDGNSGIPFATPVTLFPGL